MNMVNLIKFKIIDYDDEEFSNSDSNLEQMLFESFDNMNKETIMINPILIPMVYEFECDIFNI
jgi:hypothetical protein